MKNIPVIVLTGGPCGGKTTVLSHLQQKLEDYGFKVVVVPETATELITSGISPTLVGGYNFQKCVLEHTIAKEDRWKEAASKIDASKVVLLCDRGVVDAAAYTSRIDFDILISELGLSMVDMRDKRYEAIIFLRSVATDAPNLYSNINNKARKETVDEARRLDERTLEAWTGHPHLKIIDNSTDLGGKSRRVLQAVCRVLGIPVPLEIERKFLLRSWNIAEIPRPVQAIEIEQYYLKRKNDDEEERIRLRGQNGGVAYYHTVKRQISIGVRIEIERQIDRAEYASLLYEVDRDLGKIEKTRFCFVWKDQYFELDVFRHPHGLALLEIELTEENHQVILPDFLKDAFEVTGNSEFSNYEIARSLVAAV